MIEVMPKSVADVPTIGQVVLKRLLSAEQVVSRLCKEPVFHPLTEVANEVADTQQSQSSLKPDAVKQPEPLANSQPSSAQRQRDKGSSALRKLRQLATRPFAQRQSMDNGHRPAEEHRTPTQMPETLSASVTAK